MLAPSNHQKPSTWRAWQAQNGGKRWYWRYPLAVEWALEWFVYRLRSLALFDLLELAGRATVLVVAIFWVLEAGDRAKERHYRAWDLINSARGSTGDGGRIDALQDLNKDGVSLAAAPLEHAHLFGIDLQGAYLEGADLQGAYLQGAYLEGADLQGAHLQDANLQDANLQGANLQDAHLQGADLRAASPQGASLGGANLQGASLVIANLQGTSLVIANLQGASLVDADLEGADLQGANLVDANLREVRELTQEQLDAAYGDDRTVLPLALTRPAHWSRSEGNEGQSGGKSGQ